MRVIKVETSLNYTHYNTLSTMTHNNYYAIFRSEHIPLVNPVDRSILDSGIPEQSIRSVENVCCGNEEYCCCGQPGEGLIYVNILRTWGWNKAIGIRIHPNIEKR